MAEYKRLITYAYNYESGQRRQNVGYARVEVSGSDVKIKFDIKVPSLSGRQLTIYFYKRIRGGIQLVSFGDIPVTNGIIDQKLSFTSKNIGDSGLSFDEVSGFILYHNSSKSIVADFRDISLTKEDLGCIENPITKWVPKESSQAEELSEAELVQAAEDSSEVSSDDNSEIIEQYNNKEKESIEITENEELSQERISAMAEEMKEVKVEKAEATTEEEAAKEAVKVAETVKEEAVKVAVEKVTETEKEAETRNEYISKENETVRDTEITQETESTQSVSTSSIRQEKESNKETTFPWRDAPGASKILSSFPRVYPFEDGEIAECVKIEPKNIGLLPMDFWHLGNNSFLVHSFCNYHHLLFAKKQTRAGCLYLLMVPGVYSPREKYMARMFGFEYFKCAKKRNAREGEFGYWYVTVTF